MNVTRRDALLGAATAGAFGLIGSAKAATTLKISHQFPGGTIDDGDFRDRLCRKFADEVAKRTKGEVTGEVYPNSSLMKTNAQFGAIRKGALDLTLYPLAYAGGEVPELNITLMPSLVSSYAQAARWKDAPIGQELTRILADKGVVVVSWIWQAGGCASRSKRLLGPEDAPGQKVRGGSREMELMFKDAGSAVVSLPSNESYAAMQTGAVDAVITSSTSLISFRLEELSKYLATGNGQSYWFMFEPLLMSKSVFDALPEAQRKIIMDVGRELEAFGLEAAKADDQKVIEVFKAKGAEINLFTPAVLDKWKAIARASSWKDYRDKNESQAKLMALAEQIADSAL
jgi:TRAP-type C4-dicarboxylate transport system substrate-binding protein